ncbi:phage tail protein [Acinetobacter pittii]|uniref:phage tail-collar fiber domain-containing protein n=1 Tax=Acinetobacter pittii TaxID=48296 RepID=UPI002A027771|nr:phage tail protein [Acinetobacter pittii]MDX8255259.1 phage tail protein [Acinetobacter pittii]
MSSPYYNVTTNAGDAAIANAIATNTKLNITHVAFGDGNGSSPTPDKARTTLVKEVYRQAVNKYTKHPTISNFVIVEAILPPIVGSFYIREIGIIIDSKTMITHGAVAPVFKEANSVREYRLKFTINIQDAEVVNVMLDDTLIYATQAWVNDNYVPRKEIINNLVTQDAAKPLSAAQGKALQDNKLDKTANAVSASKLLTPRAFSILGDGSATGNFDGSANLALSLTLANSGVATGTYGAVTIDPATTFIPVIQFDSKGRAIKATNVPMKSASTAQFGLTKLNSAVNSTSQSEAATPSAVKLAYDTAVNANNRSVDNKNRLDKLDKDVLLHEETTSIPNSDSIGVYKNIIGFQKKVSSIKGALVLHLPVAKNRSTTMMGLKIKGYDYRNNSGIWELNIGGYNYTSGWLSHSAALHGLAPFNLVRFGQATDHQVIILGTEETSWLYPMVLLDELITGYTNITGWREGFNFSFETDLSTFTNLSTPVLYGTPRAQNADTLMFPRTIGLSGAAVGTPTTFDGSANISIPVTSLDASKLTGTAGVNTTGSAAKLTTPRTIALSGGATGTATNFDGSANISIPVTSLDASKLTGTAGVNTTGSAAKLTTPRTIALSGAVTGTATNFDGSANISIPVTSLDASKLTGTAGINTTGSAAKLTTPRNINGVPFDGTNHITVYDSSKLPMTGGILSGALAAPMLGINNTDGTNGRGISLYGGAVNGRPNYGLYFGGTPTFGRHGDISGPWATYFSVITANDTRGWIFQADDKNVASISTNGVITGTSFVGGLKGNADTATKLSAVRTITFNGDVSGSYGFDGSVNAFCNLTVKLATTAQKGIVQLNNTLSSTATDQALSAAQGKVLADTKANLAGATFTATITAPVVNVGNATYPTIQFSPTGATNGAILQMAQSGYPYFAIRPVNSLGSSTGQVAFFGIPATKVGTHTFAMLDDIPDIVNNLTTIDATKPLSAAQGKVLNDNKISHGDYGLGQTLNIPADTLLSDLDIQNSFWSKGSAPVPVDSPVNGAFKAINFGPTPWNSQIVVPAYGNQMYLRSRKTASGEFAPWREFAFVDSNISGNAASATKLLTPRTINGASFDGTSNITVYDTSKLPLTGGTISGNLTVTGNLSTDRFNGSAAPLAFLTGSSARGINIGQLLVSNEYADVNKVPVNGGYIKGSLIVGGGITGNASSASKLATARTISATGDGSWSVSFDGNTNVSATFTLANSGVAAGTYQSVTVDAKGRVTAGQTVTTGLVTSNAATGTTNTATSNTNTFLNVVESKGGIASSVGTSTQVTGAGSVTVSSDTAGKLVITGTNTTYTAGNGLSLTGTVFSAKLLNVLNSTDATSALTAAQGKVLKDTVDIKLDKAGGTITGDLAVKGKFTLDQSNLVVVSGSNYQITYDYATRIATIEMTLFENKRIMDAMPRYSSRNAWVFALEVSLPIQLKKRLTEHFYISEYLEGQTQFGEEASEWMFNCMPSNYQPYSKDANGAYVDDPTKRVSAVGDSKVFILARRWSGDQDEPCNGYLRVTGFF